MERLMSTIPVKLLSAPERRRRRGIITMGVLGLFGLITNGHLPPGLEQTADVVVGRVVR